MNCPSCNYENTPGNTFCENCGYSLESEVAETSNIYSISEREDVYKLPDLLIPCGIAEDGIPLALSIKRSLDNWKQLFDLPKNQRKIISEIEPHIAYIEQVIKREWVKQGIYNLELPDGSSVNCYISKKNMTELFQPSLLSLLIPFPKGLPQDDDGENKAVARVTQVVSRKQRTGHEQSLSSTGGQNRFLAISLQDERLFVIGWEDNRNVRTPVFQREFISESLASINDCRFLLYEKSRNRYDLIERYIYSGEIQDLYSYAMEYFEVAKSNMANLEPKFCIPNNTLANIVVQVAYKLEEYHHSGRVHGDIKPHNILLTSSGPQLIDDLNLRVGKIAPAVTPGWAAPEQMIAHQVMCSTDIYPLGIMLAGIINGQLTGEIISYSIPSSNRTSKIVQLIRSPMVYIDENNTIIPEKGLMDWFQFLEKCLDFNPSLRFGSGAECAEALENLLEKYPLTGDARFNLDNRGVIEYACSKNGTKDIFHIRSDHDWDSTEIGSNTNSYSRLTDDPFGSF